MTVAGVSKGLLVCYAKFGEKITELGLKLKEHYVLQEDPKSVDGPDSIEAVWLEANADSYVLGIIAPREVDIRRDDY